MAIRKTLSFTDSRVVEWINKSGGSKYIARLVMDDMENIEGNFISRDEVIKLIEDRIGKSKCSNKVENRIDKESIKGLIEF